MSFSKLFSIRVLIGVYVFCVFALIGSYFAVSTRQLQTAAFVRAAPSVVVNKPNVLRAIYINVPTGRNYNNGFAKLHLRSQTIEEKIPRHGFIQLLVKPPPDDKDAKLEFFSGDDHFELQFELDAKKETPWVLPVATKRRSEREGKQKIISQWEGEDTIELIPQTAEVATGLDDEIFFITRRKGVPTSMKIDIISVEGRAKKLPATMHSNVFGMAKLTVNLETSIRLDLEIKGPDDTLSKGKLNLFAVPSQFSIHLRKNYVPYGEELRGSVTSLRRQGALFVDAYYRDRWANSSIFGLGKHGTSFSVLTETNEEKLIFIEVYNSFFGASTSWDGQWMAVGPAKDEGDYCKIFSERARTNFGKRSPQWPKDILSSEKFRLATRSQCRVLLSAYLASLPIQFYEKNTIANSRERDREGLKKWRDERKLYLKYFTTLFLLAGFAFVLYLVLKGFQERKRLDFEFTDDLDPEEFDSKHDFESVMNYLRIGIVLLAIATFIAAVLMVMSFM